MYFTDYTEAEFSSKGELQEVKSPKVLTALISPKVMSYINKNYKGVSVVHWEKEGRKQKVKLNNGLELEFDLKGIFF